MYYNMLNNFFLITEHSDPNQNSCIVCEATNAGAKRIGNQNDAASLNIDTAATLLQSFRLCTTGKELMQMIRMKKGKHVSASKHLGKRMHQWLAIKSKECSDENDGTE